MKNWWVYVLRLEQGKYYVGITSKTPEQRLRQHQNGFLAAQWTKKFKPLEIVETHELKNVTLEQAQVHEARLTRQYIEKYGLDNVRGGDVTYSGKYFKRFGLFFRDNDWQVITVTVFLLIVIAYLTIENLFD